uniref:Uncharacterized protein n=1 Tax=Cacopsylla melanoneura TaxID=428564 RepID=A0A8D9EGB2_9HEMI
MWVLKIVWDSTRSPNLKEKHELLQVVKSFIVDTKLKTAYLIRVYLSDSDFSLNFRQFSALKCRKYWLSVQFSVDTQKCINSATSQGASPSIKFTTGKSNVH